MKKMMLAAVLAVAAGGASAQGYAGALIGLTKVNTSCLPGATCDDSDNGYKAYGGFNINPNVAVEVGYTDFGKFSISGPGGRAEIKGTALSVVGAFRAQFSKEVAGVARLGFASVKGKLSSTVGASGSDDNLKVYAGLGIEYAFGDDLKISAAADFTDVEYDGGSGTAYIAGIGLQYGF